MSSVRLLQRLGIRNEGEVVVDIQQEAKEENLRTNILRWNNGAVGSVGAIIVLLILFASLMIADINSPAGTFKNASTFNGTLWTFLASMVVLGIFTFGSVVERDVLRDEEKTQTQNNENRIVEYVTGLITQLGITNDRAAAAERKLATTEEKLAQAEQEAKALRQITDAFAAEAEGKRAAPSS